jgi:hypothetical protein
MCKQEKRVSGISDGLFNVVVNLWVPRQQPFPYKLNNNFLREDNVGYIYTTNIDRGLNTVVV